MPTEPTFDHYYRFDELTSLLHGLAEAHPELLSRYRLIIGVGHDEYWSGPMRENVEAYLEAGGNFALFSGNSVNWQVRFEDGGRTIRCHKEVTDDDPAFMEGNVRTLTTLLGEAIARHEGDDLLELIEQIRQDVRTSPEGVAAQLQKVDAARAPRQKSSHGQINHPINSMSTLRAGRSWSSKSFGRPVYSIRRSRSSR